MPKGKGYSMPMMEEMRGGGASFWAKRKMAGAKRSTKMSKGAKKTMRAKRA